MEHAYNSGCKRTHSHQIQLDGGGGSANKTVQILARASNEQEASLTSPAMSFCVRASLYSLRSERTAVRMKCFNKSSVSCFYHMTLR